MYTSNSRDIRTQNIRRYFRTCRNSNKPGFTLIELLVVIAIIALLLGIVVPALRIAKEKGAMAVCLYNVRQLSTAWFNYTEENKGKLINPDVKGGGWVEPPLRPDGSEWVGNPTPTDPITDEDEQRGIEKGTFFPYVKAFDAYHCPGDKIRKSMYDLTYIFRTYSIPGCLGTTIKKYNEIKTPGMSYNFVEEAECRGYNQGTWDLTLPTIAGNTVDRGQRWRDPIGVNHGDNGVLGFCDGHAEIHRWVDPWTKERVRVFFETGKNYNGYGAFEQANFFGSRMQFNDIDYMVAGWAYRGFPK